MNHIFFIFRNIFKQKKINYLRRQSLKFTDSILYYTSLKTKFKAKKYRFSSRIFFNFTKKMYKKIIRN